MYYSNTYLAKINGQTVVTRYIMDPQLPLQLLFNQILRKFKNNIIKKEGFQIKLPIVFTKQFRLFCKSI